MAIELKQTVGLSQQLVITPQLQQAIKLLQLSRLELMENVQQELMENPVLEELSEDHTAEDARAAPQMDGDVPPPDQTYRDQTEEVGGADGALKEPSNFDWENYENYISSSYLPSSGGAAHLSADDLPSYENTLSEKETLQDHLIWQLHVSGLSREDEEFGIEIIGNINDDGYLTAELSEIAQKLNCPLERLETLLLRIQEMDPLGVGARSLTECLLLQLKFYKSDLDRNQLTEMITNHLKLLEKHDYNTLAKTMKLPLRRVVQLAKMVGELEPKPGRPYGGDTVQYITPDVYVHKLAGDYTVVLNEEGMPRLQVSHFYKNLLGDQKAAPLAQQTGAKEYVQEKLRSAVWLIKSIHQRQRTLYKVTKCIVKFQREFLDFGVMHLKPMILKDVADEIGVHESTVSRATSNKYVHTPQGIFELKYFFNSGVSSSQAGEDNIAAESVKNRIKHIIASEDAKSPYSDQDLVDLLQKANIQIARRTVAKYREILGIAPSSRRKQLFK